MTTDPETGLTLDDALDTIADLQSDIAALESALASAHSEVARLTKERDGWEKTAGEQADLAAKEWGRASAAEATAERLATALEYALGEDGGFACPASTEERLRAALVAYRGVCGAGSKVEPKNKLAANSGSDNKETK